MQNKNTKIEGRTLVCGDIHGGLRSLKQVLQRSNFHTEKDRIIFLGDYVDGWSQSAELIQFLIDLQLNSKYEHIFIRGNHDKWCEDWILHGQAPLIWTQQGGQSTLDSYVKTELLVEESHRQFFKNLRNYYIDEENRGYVHGGFHSKKGLGHEVYQSDYYWDRDLWQIALLSHGKYHKEPNLLKEGVPQSRRFENHKEIFIGHTATPNWNCKPHLPEFEDPNQPTKNGPIFVPMNRCNVWNMDTGGGFKGKLSIMDVETKKYWQSDFVDTLYPNESGR